MKLKFCLAVIVGLVATTVFAQTATTTGPAASLHAVFDREWEWELGQDPLWASYLGDRRWNDRWPDISSQALAARQAHRQAVLKELVAIPRDQLSTADRLNYDLFRHQYQTTVEGFQYRQHLIRTSTLDGVQNTEFVIDSLRFQTVKDFEDWLARLDAFPAYMDQNIALMREGMKGNVLLPKIVVNRVREQVVQLTKQTRGRQRLLPAVSQHALWNRRRRSRAPDASRRQIASERACSPRSCGCSSSSIASICRRATTASGGGGRAAGLRAIATSRATTRPRTWRRRISTRSA